MPSWTTFNEAEHGPGDGDAQEVQDKSRRARASSLGFMSSSSRPPCRVEEVPGAQRQRRPANDIVLPTATSTSASRSVRRVAWSCRSCATRPDELADIEKKIAEYGKKGGRRQARHRGADRRHVLDLNGGWCFGSMLSTPIINPHKARSSAFTRPRIARWSERAESSCVRSTTWP